MFIHKEKLKNIENAFSILKSSNQDYTKALFIISENLSSITGKSIQVIITDNKLKESFVMSVYPDESTISQIISAIASESKDSVLVKLWNGCNNWTIEIDKRILGDEFGLSEQELTALILHEIGHIVYSNSVPMRISKIVRFKIAKSPMIQKALFSDNFIFSKILSFPIVNACNVKANKIDIKNEIRADKYSINAGYGQYLNSAMDKIIIHAGEVSYSKQMEDLTDFSIDTITSIMNRQIPVTRRTMLTMIRNTPSKVASDIYSKIYTGLSGSAESSVTEERKDDFINKKIDSIIEKTYEVFTEGLFNRVVKLKRIDPAELDYIAIEIDNIKSNDDKMMLISYIYSKIEIVDYYLSIISSNNRKYSVPHSKESLLQIRERLARYRDIVISQKIPEINYGISIQWPTGYEG